jgi:50S ribosome-binding GTPase
LRIAGSAPHFLSIISAQGSTEPAHAAGVTVREALFKAIVSDLETLRDAYSRAGLLTDGGQGSLAYTLLGGGEAADRFRRDTLLLDAVVRNRVARLVFDRHGPRHVVVFGGNNVGKSTVVNILAAASTADTSPEGGHTRQAHAFSTTPPPLFPWNPYAFNRFAQVAADQPRPDTFDCYTVRQIEADVLPANIVLWDSPDCDAVGSTRYLAAVVEAAAVADLVVYVTSVEKYAVADLVEWLFHLSDAGIPIIECLNKTPKKDRLAVMRKQIDDLFPAVAQRLGLPAPMLRMMALRYMADGEEADLWGADHPEAAALRAAVLESLPTQDTMNQAHAALRFVCHRIERVLEPARMELSVQNTWKATVDTGVVAFITTYENEYLTGPTVIDPFKQLNVALLELLNPDIPQLRTAIRALRAVQRIPVDLLKRGWRLVSEHGEAAKFANLAPEQKAYATAHRALLSAIVERIDRERRNPRHHPLWDRLAEEWDHQATRLADEFSQATIAHMMQSDAVIKAAARDILQALQQRPGVLNLLRAARVSTDIGGLLVGFIIPGHGHIGHDLLDRIVIAPLMLSATGVAAESAVEGYVAQRRSQIVDKLRADAREIAAKLYSQPLDDLGNAVMARIGTLGVEQDLLDRIQANLLRLQQIVGRPAGAHP